MYAFYNRHYHKVAVMKIWVQALMSKPVQQIQAKSKRKETQEEPKLKMGSHPPLEDTKQQDSKMNWGLSFWI